MELWIRSQDKRRLMKVDEIWLNEAGTIFCNNTIYASYSEKRALEVLEEIQKRLDGRWIKENMPSSVSMQNIFPIMFYEMPEE